MLTNSCKATLIPWPFHLNYIQRFHIDLAFVCHCWYDDYFKSLLLLLLFQAEFGYSLVLPSQISNTCFFPCDYISICWRKYVYFSLLVIVFFITYIPTAAITRPEYICTHVSFFCTFHFWLKFISQLLNRSIGVQVLDQIYLSQQEI